MPDNSFECKKRSTGGFSLVEALIVVVMLGILAMLTVPRLEPILASRNVSGARSAFTNLYSLARLAASQNRTRATVSVTGGVAQAKIDLPGGGTQRVGQAIFFDSLYRVQAVATPTSLTIQPSGLITAGLPFELELQRSTVYDTVRITGYGKVQ